MANNDNGLCIKLPEITKIPSITLLGGAELKGFVDFTQGTPTDCKIYINLLLQLAPLLASMACLLKILNVIGKLPDFIEALKSVNPNKIKNAAPELVEAIEDLKGCIPAFALPQIIIMFTGIFDLIINFLFCFITQFDKLIDFRASLDFESAKGNPVLFDALICARDNAQLSMDTLMLSLQSIQPILMMIKMVAEIAGISVSLPDLPIITVSQAPQQIGQGHDQVKKSLQEAIASMQQTVAELTILSTELKDEPKPSDCA